LNPRHFAIVKRKESTTMAGVNVERRRDEEERSLERRYSGGITGRFRGLNRGPEDYFTANPFTLLRRLTEDMDRMFSGALIGREFMGREAEGWAPAVEVRERDGQLVVTAELPGLNREDVKVEVNDEGLVIQGERRREHEEERGGVRRSERSYGAFYRLIPLPEGANLEQAKAQINNGVLEVRVPIPEGKQKNRQIPIEAGDDRKPVASQAGQQAGRTSKAVG
jgi:HSP20 family protein